MLQAQLRRHDWTRTHRTLPLPRPAPESSSARGTMPAWRRGAKEPCRRPESANAPQSRRRQLSVRLSGYHRWHGVHMTDRFFEAPILNSPVRLQPLPQRRQRRRQCLEQADVVGHRRCRYESGSAPTGNVRALVFIYLGKVRNRSRVPLPRGSPGSQLTRWQGSASSRFASSLSSSPNS